MGTTLTGTTPQDTYDSLIKVTDNGPISGTLKALSDGLGNDSTLSLSTTAASIAGTLAVTGNVTIDTSTLVVDAANNRVGVGIAAPTTLLDIQAAGSAVGSIRLSSAVNTNGAAYFVENAGGGSYFGRNSSTGGAFTGAAYSTVVYGGGAYPMSFYTNDTERMRILSDGNVGIGTSAPAANLHIASATDGGIRIQGSASGLSYIDLADTASGTPAGSIAYNHISNAIIFSTDTNVERARITSNGLSFNGDTAAANALDDYEEGTWTMGVSFGGASVGVTTSINTGTYTKIGRQVTVNGFLILTNKGSSSGVARITGLPYVIANDNAFYTTASIRLANVTFANQFQGYGIPNTSQIEFEEITVLGAVSSITNADFSNSSEVIISLTYFVP